jgi:hypothetical protein
MLYNREAEPGTAGNARASKINAIEAFSDARDMFLRDANALITYGEPGTT